MLCLYIVASLDRKYPFKKSRLGNYFLKKEFGIRLTKHHHRIFAQKFKNNSTIAKLAVIHIYAGQKASLSTNLQIILVKMGYDKKRLITQGNVWTNEYKSSNKKRTNKSKLKFIKTQTFRQNSTFLWLRDCDQLVKFKIGFHWRLY